MAQAHMASESSHSELETRLGHSFRDPALLRQALTHPSTGGKLNNQRLEFLGDRVLGLVIADALYAHFSRQKEGGLARRLASLVKKDTLAVVARTVELDRHLRLGRGADDEGGRQKPAILADACEAVIAALYLDGGIKAARQFILREWDGFINEEARAARDPKSALQEWAQGRGLAPPVYREVGRTGPDHAPRFVIEASIEGLQSVQGEGTSKRLAEKKAAQAMLERIGDD